MIFIFAKIKMQWDIIPVAILLFIIPTIIAIEFFLLAILIDDAIDPGHKKSYIFLVQLT